MLIQISDAKGKQVRSTSTAEEARALAQQLRDVLAFADRAPVRISERGETVQLILHRQDGLEMAEAIDAIARS
ncbi:MAG: hypothetical protein DI537_17415 [Stutzerimonas stutzeri]|nr:MAG: hypothetical protein DI537_17415 [Stutzerimonas stutzeri]